MSAPISHHDGRTYALTPLDEPSVAAVARAFGPRCEVRDRGNLVLVDESPCGVLYVDGQDVTEYASLAWITNTSGRPFSPREVVAGVRGKVDDEEIHYIQPSHDWVPEDPDGDVN